MNSEIGTVLLSICAVTVVTGAQLETLMSAKNCTAAAIARN